MYEVEAFAVGEPGPLLAGLLGQVAATLVTTGPSGLTSTVLPLLYDAEAGPLGTLLGHVARGNPIVREHHDGPALVVATGAAGYVSPSWYPAKAEHGKVVPTWDYVTVDAGGPLVLHDDAAWLLDVVTRLTDRHEAGRPAPWAVTDAPEAYVAAMLRGIVGIELRLDRLVGKAKLSQNRSDADRAGVLAGLRAEGDPVAHLLATAVARPPA
ncbi:FMN-binding negative transcriptional regulator [Aquihabitans sp. G128]|uniref:FMN-binding negative transcriptional regulator n=1 Tax=Aquihabitans sp. G128 TaxID=2849779 RepID=UPI001C239FF4|nr:FMN-binding negative transcriptional regulator [Aquihabitans sp. G128]QXC62002.1 FMN-binding negative transcriptional regulator [Aquihabitans sp. G128]